MVGPVVGLVGVDLDAVAGVEGVLPVLQPEGHHPGEHIDKLLPGVDAHLRPLQVGVGQEEDMLGEEVESADLTAQHALDDLGPHHGPMGAEAVDHRV